MKIVQIKSLRLFNFKGLKDLAISFNDSTNIYGANEIGKSTVYTAFNWLLTGKDEFDRKDYEIKNTKYKELNSQAHEVEGVFSVDNREEKFKRVYLEKWVKPKGQSQRVFEGHTTEYWHNDVPCSLSEYQAAIDEIIPANIIKLITNPTFFNSLNWEKQRSGLIQIAGEISDSDIFDAIATPQNDYSDLIGVLNQGNTIEKWKKEIAAKKLLLKKAALEFQPRIDEAKRNKPEVFNWELIEKEIADKVASIQDIDNLLSDASKALAEKQRQVLSRQKELYAKQTALQNIRFKIKTDVQAKHNAGAGEIASIQSQLRSINQNIARLGQDILTKENNIKGYLLEVDRLDNFIAGNRSKWADLNSRKFEFSDDSCKCPTCQQLLPTDQIEGQKLELLNNFNEDISYRKADEVRKSDASKTERADQERKIERSKSDIVTLRAEIDIERSKLPELDERLLQLQAAESNKAIISVDAAVEALLNVNADALNLRDEISCLENEIKAHTEALGTDKESEAYKLQRKTLHEDLDFLKKKLANKETIDKTDKRIADLEIEEQANAQAIADLEQREFNIETYTRAKMDMIEKKVNGMFKYVSFRLFDKQVNGNIIETCVCEYEGVPYPTLNTAAKLLSGIDVLNVLSEFYSICAPVFCDNRESVTFIPDSKSQIISLYVSPEDKRLRIEAA